MINLNLIVSSSFLPALRLLSDAGLKYETASCEEKKKIHDLPPVDYVTRMACEKAAGVFMARPHDVVIGVASLLVVNGRKLFPPKTAEQAKFLLKKLSGGTHKVYSSVAIFSEIRQCNFYGSAGVKLRKLDDDTITRYVATGEVFEGAAGYSLLGKGASLVDSIIGNWYAAAGLLMPELAERLKRDYGIVIF